MSFIRRQRRQKMRQGRMTRRQSAFGGTVMSMSEVEQLSDKIQAIEAAELRAFESEMERDLKDI